MLSHAIGLQRLSNAEARRVSGSLRAVEADLRRQILLRLEML